MPESLAEKAKRARRGEKVSGGTEVPSAEYIDTLAGEAVEAGTTAGREKMGSPDKPESQEAESVLTKAEREKARKAGQKAGMKAVK